MDVVGGAASAVVEPVRGGDCICSLRFDLNLFLHLLCNCILSWLFWLVWWVGGAVVIKGGGCSIGLIYDQRVIVGVTIGGMCGVIGVVMTVSVVVVLSWFTGYCACSTWTSDGGIFN